jgi:hypothetical protein
LQVVVSSRTSISPSLTNHPRRTNVWDGQCQRLQESKITLQSNFHCEADFQGKYFPASPIWDHIQGKHATSFTSVAFPLYIYWAVRSLGFGFEKVVLGFFNDRCVLNNQEDYEAKQIVSTIWCIWRFVMICQSVFSLLDHLVLGTCFFLSNVDTNVDTVIL